MEIPSIISSGIVIDSSAILRHFMHHVRVNFIYHFFRIVADSPAIYVMQSEKRDRFKNVEISIRADRAGKCLCNAVMSIHIPHSMTKL